MFAENSGLDGVLARQVERKERGVSRDRLRRSREKK
jgi:hypothetical protein